MSTNLMIRIGDIGSWNPENGKELIDAINKLPGKTLGQVTLSDLMLPASECHGVYLFQQGEHYTICEEPAIETTEDTRAAAAPYWYIGKTSSRALVERIGSHIAASPGDFMNILMRNVAWLRSGIEKQSDFVGMENTAKKEACYQEAMPIVLDLKLKMILFGNGADEQVKAEIEKVEKLLIRELHPLLNNPNSKKNQSRKMTIKDK